MNSLNSSVVHRSSGWSGLKSQVATRQSGYILFRETVTLDISQIQSEIKRLSDVVEKQGEEIVALREENRSLRDRICTAHVMSENPNSSTLCNVDSSVNVEAEIASIQSTSNGKVTKSPRSANPGGELASETESSGNCVANMTDESPKQTVIEGQASYTECATYSEMVKRNQGQVESSQADQTSQQKEVSSKLPRKTTELQQDRSTAEKGENGDGFIGVKRQ